MNRKLSMGMCLVVFGLQMGMACSAAEGQDSPGLVRVAAGEAIVDHADPAMAGSLANVLSKIDPKTFAVVELSGNQVYTIGQDLVVPVNVDLKFLPGAVLSVQEGATLSIDGGLEARLHKIFEGAGRVRGDAKIAEVYPEWFFNGKYNNEDYDWSDAIARAVDFSFYNCKIVALQSRVYNVDHVINLGSTTKKNLAGMKFAGKLRSTQYQRGTALLGNTGSGKPIIETTDTDGLHVVDIALRVGTRNPSSIGLLQARGQQIGWGGDHYYENLYVNMGSSPKDNNGVGTIGVINLAAEETRYHNLQAWANLPLVFTWTDNILVTNPELNGTQRSFRFPASCGLPLAKKASNTVFTLSGLGRLIAYDYVSPCLLLNSVATLDMGHTFMQMRKSGAPGVIPGKYHYAIENWNTYQFRYFGSVEGAKSFILSRRALMGADIRPRLSVTAGKNKMPLIQLYDDGGRYPWTNVEMNFHSYDTDRELINKKQFQPNRAGGFTVDKNCVFKGNLKKGL